MKVWEFEEGKLYVSDLDDGTIYKTINRDLFYRTSTDYMRSYICYNNVKDANFNEYVPQIDWSKIEVDTKILVKHNESDDWIKRYFAKYEDNKIYAWTTGSTSFSHDYEDDIACWKYTKLYTEEGET